MTLSFLRRQESSELSQIVHECLALLIFLSLPYYHLTLLRSPLHQYSVQLETTHRVVSTRQSCKIQKDHFTLTSFLLLISAFLFFAFCLYKSSIKKPSISRRFVMSIATKAERTAPACWESRLTIL